MALRRQAANRSPPFQAADCTICAPEIRDVSCGYGAHPGNMALGARNNTAWLEMTWHGPWRSGLEDTHAAAQTTGIRVLGSRQRGCSALNTVSKRRSALDAQHHGQRTQQSALDTALVALGLGESQCPMEWLENDNCNGTARNGTSKIPIIRHRLQLPSNITSSMVDEGTQQILKLSSWEMEDNVRLHSFLLVFSSLSLFPSLVSTFHMQPCSRFTWSHDYRWRSLMFLL